jgi:hypothetical protein
MMAAESQVAGVVDVETLEDLDQVAGVVVQQAGGRVLLNLSPEAAADVACMVARHEATGETNGAGLLGEDWVRVVVQLLVTGAALREPRPIPVLVRLLQVAS